METTTFSRRPFEVEAIQVTEENIKAVAEWCRGKVLHAQRTAGTIEPYIKVQTHRPANKKQTMAFIGDWILRAETGFKIYTDAAMQNSFEERRQTRNVFEDNQPEPTHEAVKDLLEEDVDAFLADLEKDEPSGPESGHKFTKFLEEE